MHEHEQDKSSGLVYSKGHLLIMALCCLVPVVILAVIVAANVGDFYVPFLLVFLCPLMMLLMHFLPQLFMRKKRRTEENHD